MITRNRLYAILVLLAGLTAGYLLSRGATVFQESWLSAFPDSYSKIEIPSTSVANLSILYDRNKEQFQEVLIEGSDLVRETAMRKHVLEQAQNDQLISRAETELAILRLKDYYAHFYLNYFRWLDTGDGQSAVQYKLSLGQFKATLDYTIENQGRDPVLLPGKIENLQQFVRIAKQSDRTIRWARVMVVVLLFLLVMGIPRFIRSIGYKRFAASLYFDAVFRPMLLSDLNAWYSTQRMAVAFLGLYLFAWVVCSSFISWRIPLILGTLGLIPVIMYTLFSHSSEKLPSRFLSFMAPKMLLLIPVLGIVALRGPNFFWHRIWGMELFRMFFFSLTTLLIFHKLRVNMILIRKWTHGSRGGSAALVFLALGIQLLVTGTLLYSFGPEESLATLNSEVQLLPGTLIGSPSELLKWLMPVAGILSVLTFLYTHTNRRKENKSIKS